MSPRSKSPRSKLVRFIAGAIVVTMGLTGLPGIPASEAQVAEERAETKKASDIPPPRSSPLSARRTEVPPGDFSNPPPKEGEAPSFPVAGPDRRGAKAGAVLVARDARTETYDNGNGTSTVVTHTRPVSWKDRLGRWQPLDARLVADGSDFKNASGPVDFKVMGETKGGDLVRASHPDGWSFGFSLEGAAEGKAGRVDGSKILYPEVVPGVDLEEEVTASGIKETVVLKRPLPADTPAKFRFPLSLSGLSPIAQADGSIAFFDAKSVEVARMPKGVAFDSSGDRQTAKDPRSAPVELALVRVGGAWVAEASVDRAWLDAATYPVSVDPSAVFQAGRQSGHWDTYVSSTSPAANYNGDAQIDGGQYVDKIGFAGGGEYQSFLKYDMPAGLSASRVTEALWKGKFYSTGANPNQFAMYKVTSSWNDGNPGGVTWYTRPSNDTVSILGATTAADQWVDRNMNTWVADWLNAPSTNHGVVMKSGPGAPSSYFRLAADEAYGSGDDSYIAITFNNTAPTWPSQTDLSPVDLSTTMSTTPTLSVSPAVTDLDNDAVKYWFRVGTDLNAEYGQVINSGWLPNPSFQVPSGSLQDGVTYYWKVFTWDGWGSATPVNSNGPVTFNPVRFNSLKVNLRLGDQGSSPMDTEGPVQVNLANGNAVIRTASPTLKTVGGDVGLAYTYSSKAPSPYGLKAEYFNACNGSTPSPFSTQPILVRTDSAVSFNWGTGSPAPGIVGTDDFCVRWTGLITTPRTNTYCFGATRDDGVKIYINDILVLDSWFDQATSWDAGGMNCLPLLTSRTNSLRVEYYEHGGGAQIDLWASGAFSPIPVPSSWLSMVPPAVPSGWSLSANTSAGLAYTEARVSGDSIVLVEPSGATHEYKKTDVSGLSYKPQTDSDAVVSVQAGGNITVFGEDGLTYTFNNQGRLQSATSGTDDTTPAAPRFLYSGDSGRLSSIQDPVSLRSITLTYSAPNGALNDCPTPPAGFTAAPSGMLCQVAYPDGSVTSLSYNSNGQLTRIVDPGGPLTDFAYDASGRIAKILDPLNADAITAGWRTDNDNARTVVSYEGAGRVASVTLPDNPGYPREAHSYRYVAPDQTQIDVAGLAPAVGFARKVVFDANSGRTSSDTDATNRTTSFAWDQGDRLVSTTDPAGLKTTTVYDGGAARVTPAGWPTDSYGPAPASCFTGQTPNGTCTNPTVAHATKAYDEAMSGLAAAYWTNTGLSGPPALHATGVGDPTGALNVNWGTGQPAGLNAPGADSWSARFTGEILLPNQGDYTFNITSDDGVRLYIDYVNVVDNWYCCGGFSGVFNGAAAGRHRIRLDYYEATSPAYLTLAWSGPGVSGIVPGANLFPRYGLATSSVDADSHKTASEYGGGATGLGPHHGLATATIADPAGKNLRTTTGYEAPGSGGYLRPVSTTLPRWQGSSPAVQTSYAYYLAADPVPANTCGIGSGVTQVGRLKTLTDPDPDGTGTKQARQRLFLYDTWGRQVGVKYTGDATWACTSYDSRGRVASVTNRSGAVTTYTYQVTNIAISGPGGATNTSLDYLGRVGNYRDEWGVESGTWRDQAGRVVRRNLLWPSGYDQDIALTTYDDAGRPLSITENMGTPRTTTFTYDAAGRRQATNRPGGWTTTDGYDPNRGQLASITNQSGGGAAPSWTYTRNPSGTIATQGGTRQRAFTYDAAGRLTTTSENGGSTIRNYAYDANTNRCSTTTTCDGSYSFDNADRVTASPYASAYSYDDVHGNLMSTTGAAGNPSMTFNYDANDHATMISDGTTRVDENLSPSGRVLRRKVTTIATGVVTEDLVHVYADGGDSPVYTQPYPDDLDYLGSSVTLISDSWWGANGAPWTSWWTTSTVGTATIDTQNGQGRLVVTGAADTKGAGPQFRDGNLSLTYQFSDRNPTSSIRFTMRGTGSPLQSGYRLDVQSDISTVKLRRFSGGSNTVVASFTYTKDTNAQRLRLRLQGGRVQARLWLAGTTEPTTWQIDYTDSSPIPDLGFLQLHANGTTGTRSVSVDDLTLTNSQSVAYIPGPGGILQTVTDGEIANPLVDAHGDIVATGNITGVATAVPAVQPDEYGKGPAPSTRLGWLGTHERFTEGATSIVRMGVRLYDPNLGRFLQVDPVVGGSCNNYDYVCGDPVNGFDLDGTVCFRCLGRNAKTWWKRNGSTVIAVGGMAAGALACSTVIGCVGVAAAVGVTSIANSAVQHKMLPGSRGRTRADSNAFLSDVAWGVGGVALAGVGTAGARGVAQFAGSLGSGADEVAAVFRWANALIGGVSGGMAGAGSTITNQMTR